MPSIYFEKQVASLCGQHLLNNLLQGKYFEASDLADIALELDQKERELGLSVDALRQESHNVDAGGNFSIQVLETALEKLFSIKLLRDDAVEKALKTIDDQSETESNIEQIAFAFNFENHWFCSRYLYHRFWILNSLEERPQPISRTMLTMYVSQIKAEGWSVFVTSGTLPQISKNEDSS